MVGSPSSAQSARAERAVMPAAPGSRREHPMNWKTSTIVRVAHAAAVAGLACALLLASGGALRAQSKESGAKHGLAGAWLVQVTLRNCATNAPLGTFDSIVTFHRGGTLSESTSSPAFAIGQRGPGHGAWASEGHHTFSQRMVSQINFDTAPNLPGPGFDPGRPVTPGFFAGWATVTHTLELSDADHATSVGTNDFYRKGESVPYRSGCSSAVATRFE